MSQDSVSEQPGSQPPASEDDTAAFQRFYREADPPPEQGLFHRLLVGWWRRDRQSDH